MDLANGAYSLEYDGVDFTITLAEGVFLVGQLWRPPGNAPSHIFVYLHGLGAFITMKRDLFSIITATNAAVFACDHYGHGRSPGVRTACTVEEIEDETLKVLEFAHSMYPAVPMVLYGHSMGGLAGIFTVLRSPDHLSSLNLRSVIIEAPWLFPCPARPIGAFERVGVGILGTVWPTFRMPKGANSITPDLDPRWTELLRRSPLYVQSLTPRLFLSVDKAQKFVQENCRFWPSALPLLFLQGGKDALADPVGNEEWVRRFQEVPGHKVVYRLYPEATHFMLKGPDRPAILQEILDFIHATLGV
jgi:acylglycerol lipase